MATEIALFRNFGLSTSSNFAYSSSLNAFVGNIYHSAIGNQYENRARFADGLIIKEDVGSNSYGTYLNALRIYDMRTKQLICEKVYPMYCGRLYSKQMVKSVAYEILLDVLQTEARRQNYRLDSGEVSRKLNALLTQWFNKNQLEALDKSIKLLSL